jgi:hypothetical protein
VNWDTTPKTTTVTAVSGVGYFVDTTLGAITVNLPAGVAGSIVAVSDYANTAATNNITIDPNGSDKINGLNQNATISTNGAAVTLIYVDGTRGWKDVNDATLDVSGINPFVLATGGTITTCGNYKIHTFTGPGTFTVTSAGTPAGSTTVDYLVVAGGGGAGSGEQSGGGGAGGFRESVPSPAAWTASPLASTTSLPVSVTGYPITIGSGGGPATSGNPSIFSTITSTGGGGGGPGCNASGQSGGSGAGGTTAAGGPGSGNTPPVAPSQGNPGGTAGPSSDSGSRGGGGGGATAAGASSLPGIGGAGGGTGINPSPTVGTPGPSPSLRYYAGGGGGGAWTCASAPGGVGGGGNGAGVSPGTATAGTVNTGGGGGGSFSPGCTARSGGSGIIVIRYKFQ